jgi:Spy/CpxP family protein refolding chaperone
MNIRKSAIALMIVFSTGAELPVVAQAEEVVAGESQQETTTQGIRRHGDFMARWAKVMELTDAQKSQIKDLVQKEHQAKAPLMQQIKEGKRQLQEATQASVVNEGAVRLLMKHQAELRTDLMLSRIKLRNEIFTLLTPEQQKLAIKLRSLREGRQHSTRYFQKV